MILTRFQKLFSWITCLALFSLAEVMHGNADDTTRRPDARPVFPFDFIKFTCIKKAPFKITQDSSCTWTFLTDGFNETVTQVTADCEKTSQTSENISRIRGEEYEGYIQVPERAKAIKCEGSDEEQLLLVQNVKLAKPPKRDMENDALMPIIVLQRFSNDFAVRLGAHDVTNQEVTVKGSEITSMKLVCIDTMKVTWQNYSEPRKRILHDLYFNNKQSQLQSEKLEKAWLSYLNYLLRNLDKESTDPDEIRLGNNFTVHALPLVLKNITNATSRTYTCSRLGEARHQWSSNVSIRVEDPRNVGPDELQLIQAIIEALEALASGKGKGKEPWYTLGTLLSIVLMLFLYYCKKKLDQQPSQNPGTTPKPPEETEMQTRLHPAEQTTV